MTLQNRLKLTYDMMNTPYPVQKICVYCGKEYAPISYLPTGDKYTLCCHHIIDKPIAVCGYVSLIDLEETDWDSEL